MFGKIWAKELGFDTTQKPPPGSLMRGMIFNLIGNFLFAWVFYHNMAVWNPVTWGLEPSAVSPTANAMMAAVFTWLGFYVPVDLNTVAWEMKSWRLFFINTGYHLVSLIFVALILGNMM